MIEWLIEESCANVVIVTVIVSQCDGKKGQRNDKELHLCESSEEGRFFKLKINFQGLETFFCKF